MSVILFYPISYFFLNCSSLGAATLGSMMCNVTGYSVIYGMGTALDSMLSQAYGAKSYRMVGLYAQRAMV
jgi:MATE family multidrug resistance protein